MYVANYASGNVGPHALIEMDEAASDLSKGIIALSEVAAQVGVNKYTGKGVSMLTHHHQYMICAFKILD